MSETVLTHTNTTTERKLSAAKRRSPCSHSQSLPSSSEESIESPKSPFGIKLELLRTQLDLFSANKNLASSTTSRFE